MRSAIVLRVPRNGIRPRSTRPADNTGAARVAKPLSNAASTSRFTMRPPGPVPLTAARSKRLSAAIFFASGEAMIRPLVCTCGGSATVGVDGGVAAVAGASGVTLVAEHPMGAV